MKCDFCSGVPITKTYPAVSGIVLSVGEIDHASEGGWSSCSACSMLIDAGDYVGLERRIYQSGVDILGECSMSHKTVWKIINKFKELRVKAN